MEWLTRYGAKYEARNEVKNYGPQGGMLGSPAVVHVFAFSAPYDIDAAKGTARYDYEDTCNRCGGAGGGGQWAHTGWTCFECGGSGKGGIKTARLYTADRLAKLNAAQAKRDAVKMAQAQAAAKVREEAARDAWREFCAANQALINELTAYAEAHSTDEKADAFLLVSEHGERDGERQTIISRPKVLGVLDPEDGKLYTWDSATHAMVVVA